MSSLPLEAVLSMKKDLNYYLNLPYRVEVIPDEEEGGYAFRIPEPVSYTHLPSKSS